MKTGGAEKLILDCIPLYKKKGIHIELLLLDSQNTPFLEKLRESMDLKIYFLGKGSVYNPFLIRKLIPVLENFDLIHVHLFPALYWVAIAKKLKNSKILLIFTEHCTSNQRRHYWFFKFIDRKIYSLYNKFVAITSEVETNLKQHLKTNPDKFVIIENGIDLARYQDANPLSKSFFFKETDILIIQVSAFRAQKDQPTLIRALLHLPETFKLLLVGDGILRVDNEKLVKSLELSSRVKFCGVRQDVPALLKTADFIVLSSYYEGLSLSSIEGMAAGKPFLASDVPGLRDVVKSAGILFPRGDEKKLAEEILKLAENPIYYKNVSYAVSERAKEYDIEIMVEKHINLYKSLIK